MFEELTNSELLISAFKYLIVVILNFYPILLFNTYLKKKNKDNIDRKSIIIYGLSTLIINYYIMLFTRINTSYMEIVLFDNILAIPINYIHIYGKNKYIDNNKISKSFNTIMLFFLSSVIAVIPIILGSLIFKFNVNKIVDSSVLFTLITDLILLFILVIYYFNDLKNDFKKLKTDFNKNLDIGFKYWLVGLIIMMASNIIIGLFIKQAKSVNEEQVQEIIHVSKYLSIITIGLFAPIIEELIFRKAFRDVIKNRKLFIILSGTVFGALHILLSISSPWDLFLIIPYSSVGIALAMMYDKTDNIFTSIFMHIFHNTVLTLISIAGIGAILL